MSRKLSDTSRGVAHHTPGRTRLKISKAHRKHLHQLKDAIEQTPGVKSVEVNHHTGSVLVHHEHNLPIFDVLHKAVETVSGDVLKTLIEGEAAEVIGPLGLAAAAFGILEGVSNAIFSSMDSGRNGTGLITGKPSDLKTLIPTAFLLAAAVKFYQTKTIWQGVTPLLLCYWAFDTYWRFNVANPSAFEPKNGQLSQHEREHSA